MFKMLNQVLRIKPKKEPVEVNSDKKPVVIIRVTIEDPFKLLSKETEEMVKDEIKGMSFIKYMDIGVVVKGIKE